MKVENEHYSRNPLLTETPSSFSLYVICGRRWGRKADGGQWRYTDLFHLMVFNSCFPLWISICDIYLGSSIPRPPPWDPNGSFLESQMFNVASAIGLCLSASQSCLLCSLLDYWSCYLECPAGMTSSPSTQHQELPFLWNLLVAILPLAAGKNRIGIAFVSSEKGKVVLAIWVSFTPNIFLWFPKHFPHFLSFFLFSGRGLSCSVTQAGEQ